MPLGGFLGGLANLGAVAQGEQAYRAREADAAMRQQQQQIQLFKLQQAIRADQQQKQASALAFQLLQGGQPGGLAGLAGIGGQQQQQPNYNPGAVQQTQLPAPLPQVPNATAQMQGPIDGAKMLNLIARDESGGRNIPNYRFDPTHTASGPLQITDSTWNRYAPSVGAPKLQYPGSPMDRPVAEQFKVGGAILQKEGVAPWANFNPKLAADLKLSPSMQRESGQIAEQTASQIPMQAQGQMNPFQLAQQIEQIAPGADPEAKMGAMVMLHQLLSPDAKLQFQQMMEIAKFQQTGGHQRVEEAGQEAAREERERHDRAMEGAAGGTRGAQLYTPPGGGEPVWAFPSGEVRPSGLQPGSTKGAGGGGEQFSDSDVDYWARVIGAGGHFPPGLARTSAGSQFVQKVMKRIPGMGQSDPGQFIANASTVKADDRSLSNMTKMADAATSFERTASQNFDLALRLSKDAVPTDWGPFLNRWVENGETQAGNPDVPAYVAAMLTAANEYAKIMSGSTGAQGSTVDSRREAAQLFSPYLSANQIERVVGVAKADMSNRKASLYGQIDDIKSRLHAAGSGEPTATQGQRQPSVGGAQTAPAGVKPDVQYNPATGNFEPIK